MSQTLLGLRPSISRVAAKYKNKKKVKSQDGGETTIYEYGPRQIANRHKEKADRIEKFLPKLPDLRAKYRKDLDVKDPEKRLTALAVALIDHTYERVGNPQSAEENGHYGVTVWEARHVKFKGDKAEISYTGKSGVKHTKTVDDEKIVKALKAAVKDKDPEDRILCDGKDCTVGSAHVNDYLRPYAVTAKDLRGLHANEEVRKRLKEIRAKGPELPRARKEKDKILQKEFQEALEGAAEAVGHEPATLRGQYLVPGLEDSYVHDGTVLDKLNKKAARPKKGNCYEAAGKFLMDQSLFGEKGMTLVHGEVAGQGPLEGINFGHAWVEHNGMVIDKSNGRDIKIPVQVYYALGQIDRIDNTHRYTWDQANKKIASTGHWGPWDLRTSTGL
jgi:DNA topoisomerase IB